MFTPPNRILIVDDDPVTLAFAARALERDSFHVDRAHDGVEAIEKLKANEYSVIVLDILMPKLDGFGVLHYLSENRPELRQRVLIITALPGDQLAATKLEGICGVMNKPVEASELCARVRACAASPIKPAK